MEDLIRQLVAHARGAWAYRWWGVIAAWAIGIIGAVVVYVIPDKYEATARIYVDTQSLLGPLMQGLAVPADVNQQVAALSTRLISRPNVEKLIRMADLDLNVGGKAERDRLVEDVMKRLRIQSTGRDNLYTLSYMDREPQRAKRVVQSLVSIFVESGLGDKRKDSDTARRFIEDQIRIYAQKLDEAEARLKNFKLKNIAMLGTDGKDGVAQMSDVMSRLREARLALREAENSREAIRRQLSGEQPGDAALVRVTTSELDTRVESMRKGLDDLVLRYTDNHPDVIATRQALKQLEDQRAAELKNRKGAPSPVSSVVVQQLKIALSESEAQVASLRARVGEYDARVRELREFVKLGPQIEQEYAQLNRDYDVNKKNYESLVARRESANMSVDMDAASGIAEFRLIDPPSVPSKPAAPNRNLLMPLVGLLALLGGAAIAFLLSQLRPAFYDARALRETTGLPILGSVSLTPSPDRMRRERRSMVAFCSAIGSLAALVAGMTAFITVAAR